MRYTVQLFGAEWTDDHTVDLCRPGKFLTEGTYPLLAGFDGLSSLFDSLSEACAHADQLWDLFWETRSDNFLDENPQPDWQFVVAVFRENDEAGEQPLYIRGYYASEYAPWMHWANVQRKDPRR